MGKLIMQIMLVEKTFLLSSAVERATVNRLVPGSNPGEGVGH